jgi:signal transduction histidine kinase
MTRNSESLGSVPSILVVDDDPKNLITLEAVLEDLSCRVVRADSGSKAIARSRVEKFAAIIMDVRMPGLDGYATASFIRQDPLSACTPILFITAHEDIDVDEFTRIYGNTGQVDSLRKPFEPTVLCSKVRWWLDHFRKGMQLYELEQAMDAARMESRTKDDLLSIVAHDLKGPLCAMQLSLERLRAETADDVDIAAYMTSVRSRVDRALRGIHAMTTIVDDLLDNARIESGTLHMHLSPQPLAGIVAQAVDLLQPLADQKGVALVRSGDDPGVVVCDRDRMLQVLSNLIGNGVKFTLAGGRVEIETVGLADAVRVCVADTGRGITSDELPRLFQKYWQGNRKEHQKGIGLGLAIAKEIVLAHQGRIWAESQPGEGSRFFFSVPRVVDSSGPAGAGDGAL